jgi:solute carrier family 25 carnitine/acylcarnitine transporter 20/29
MIDCAKKVIKAEGIPGLYKGMSAPMIGVTPIFAVCFWGYDMGKVLVRKSTGMADNQVLSLPQIAVAGAISAFPTTALMAPGERIKCLLQIQGMEAERGIKPKYAGTVDCVKQLFREGGLASVFRGWEATLLRDVPASMAYFGGYEGIKRALTPAGARVEDLNPFAVFMAGGFAVRRLFPPLTDVKAELVFLLSPGCP